MKQGKSREITDVLFIRYTYINVNWTSQDVLSRLCQRLNSWTNLWRFSTSNSWICLRLPKSWPRSATEHWTYEQVCHVLPKLARKGTMFVPALQFLLPCFLPWLLSLLYAPMCSFLWSFFWAHWPLVEDACLVAKASFCPACALCLLQFLELFGRVPENLAGPC